MNETLMLVAGVEWRASCSARFSSAAFGGRFARAFRPNDRRSGFSAACCCGWALSWPDFILSRGGHWQRLLLCLLGFVIARFVVTWLTRTPVEHSNSPAQEASHAP